NTLQRTAQSRDFDFSKIRFTSLFRVFQFHILFEGSKATQTEFGDHFLEGTNTEVVVSTANFKRFIPEMYAHQSFLLPSKQTLWACAKDLIHETTINLHHFFHALVYHDTLWDELGEFSHFTFVSSLCIALIVTLFMYRGFSDEEYTRPCKFHVCILER
ncbi:uncharacterized protein DEA37_0010632, partial [Paragonimus westermani]